MPASSRTIGIPILAAVAATRGTELTGIHVALAVSVAVTLASVLVIWYGLRPRGERRMAATAATVPGHDEPIGAVAFSSTGAGQPAR